MWAWGLGVQRRSGGEVPDDFLEVCGWEVLDLEELEELEELEGEIEAQHHGHLASVIPQQSLKLQTASGL